MRREWDKELQHIEGFGGKTWRKHQLEEQIVDNNKTDIKEIE
jgi:hypothetical protein